MKDRQTSGLSIKDFCKTAGFHENVYYYWQRKLREAACEELAVQEAGSEKSLVPVGWAVCATVEPVAKDKVLTVEISGCCVYVEADTDPELLSKVCRVLRALC